MGAKWERQGPLKSHRIFMAGAINVFCDASNEPSVWPREFVCTPTCILGIARIMEAYIRPTLYVLGTTSWSKYSAVAMSKTSLRSGSPDCIVANGARGCSHDDRVIVRAKVQDVNLQCGVQCGMLGDYGELRLPTEARACWGMRARNKLETKAQPTGPSHLVPSLAHTTPTLSG